ncbi:DUF3509 domain-containing protein [Pseudomonas aeruginosa]|nr:DUF3509 domain-containing protein [Pseudomonas aeruginosa]
MPSLPIPSPSASPGPMADGWSRWSIRRGNPVAAGHRQVQLNDESYLEDAVQTIRRELQVLVGRMEEDVLATFRERDHVLLYSSR